MKPEAWEPGTVDAIATGSADARRIVIKAVNYVAQTNLLVVRLQGSTVPRNARVKSYLIRAALTDAATLDEPDKIRVAESTLAYSRNLTVNLPPHSVGLIEITAE
jgi:alpha-N-arabinofuranosidase